MLILCQDIAAFTVCSSYNFKDRITLKFKKLMFANVVGNEVWNGSQSCTTVLTHHFDSCGHCSCFQGDETNVIIFGHFSLRFVVGNRELAR